MIMGCACQVPSKSKYKDLVLDILKNYIMYSQFYCLLVPKFKFTCLYTFYKGGKLSRFY